MSHLLQQSPSGILGYGSYFVRTDARSIVASLQLHQSSTSDDNISNCIPTKCPDAICFSMFDNDNSAEKFALPRNAHGRKMHRRLANTTHAAGGHVLLHYQSCDKSFFSMAILNCQTWSVRWTVKRLAANETVHNVVLLNSDVVCGVVANIQHKQGSGGRLFLALSPSCTAARKNASSRLPLMRSFVATPLFQTDDMIGERAIVAMVGWSATCVFILTSDAMLYMMNVNIRINSIEQAKPFAVGAQFDLGTAIPRITELLSTGEVIMRAAAEAEERRYVILYSSRSTSYVVVDVRNMCAGANTQVASVASRHVELGARVENILFIDAAHLVVSLQDSHSRKANSYMVRVVRLCTTAATRTETDDIQEHTLGSYSSPYAALAIQQSATRQAFQFISSSTSRESTSSFAALDPSQLVCSSLSSLHDVETRGDAGRTPRFLRWHRILTSPLSIYDRVDADSQKGVACVGRGEEKHQSSEQLDSVRCDDDTFVHTTDNHLITLHYALTSPSFDVAAEMPHDNVSASNNKTKTHKYDLRAMDLAIFSVCTSPYAHSRLAKQWHNGSQGLLHALLSSKTDVSVSAMYNKTDTADKGDAECAPASKAYTLSWNPHHLRRALRWMKQSDLAHAMRMATMVLRQAGVSALHTNTAQATAADNKSALDVVHSLRDARALQKQAQYRKEGCRGVTGSLFCDVATATVDIAVQIITVASQIGAQLNPLDVEEVAVLLRASRKCGHVLLHHICRMQMLTENYIQQQVLRRLTSQSQTSAEYSSVVARELDSQPGCHAPEDSSYEDANIERVITGWHPEKRLHTRYTANSWAIHSRKERERYNATIAGAAQYLGAVQSELQKVGPSITSNAAAMPTISALSDWELLGTRPCFDTVMNEFESTLVPHMQK